MSDDQTFLGDGWLNSALGILDAIIFTSLKRLV
jgi:hypothetical protein